MSTKTVATLTSKGQITVPAEVRRQWNLKPGDQIAFEVTAPDQGTIKPRHRRSIFDRLEELKFPTLGKSLTQTEIDESIAADIAEKFGKSGGKT